MTTPNLPRALERYSLGEKLDGERWNATDRDRGRDVVVTRVAFGRDRRAERDAYVERMRRLYTVTHPALVSVYDAGAWDDDAFVVEERVVEPQPIGEMDLDAREKALAARSVAEGAASLHAAGWSLPAIDLVLDAYRQPKMRLLDARPDMPWDMNALHRTVERFVPDTEPSATAAELARKIVVPGPTTAPLLHAEAPRRTPLFWGVVTVGLIALLLVLAGRL